MHPRPKPLGQKDITSAPISCRVLGISGSLRPTSKTLMVLDAVMTSLKVSGVMGRTVALSALPLPLFSGYTYTDAESQYLCRFRDLVVGHDLLILASPEYHGAVSGSFKNALDHLAEDSLKGKVVGLIGVAGGSVSPVGTATQLRSVVRALGGVASPCELLVTRSKSIFDDDGEVADAHVLGRIEAFTEQLLTLSAQFRPTASAPFST